MNEVVDLNYRPIYPGDLIIINSRSWRIPQLVKIVTINNNRIGYKVLDAIFDVCDSRTRSIQLWSHVLNDERIRVGCYKVPNSFLCEAHPWKENNVRD